MTRTTITARRIYCMDRRGTVARWLSFENGRIADVGASDPPEDAMVLDGFVLPGLIDAHVHLTTTGLYGAGLDFRSCRNVTELLEEIAGFLSRKADEWVIGGNFDPGRNEEGRMPTRAELDKLTGATRLLVSRADGHSCTLNSAGLEAVGLVPGTEGIELDSDGRPTGVLAQDANYEARRRFFTALPDQVVIEGQKRGCQIALSRGVTAVHEMAGGSFMGDKDFDLLILNSRSYPILVKPYLATTDMARVLNADLDCIGGDFFLDGSIGSRTAAMSDTYLDGPGRGFLYHSHEEIVDFFAQASRAGIQAGVHAIGDAAIEQAIAAIEEVFVKLGPEGAAGARRLRHRIEHFECVSPEQIDRARRLGLVASVQPMFDGYWGGPGGMYAARLGDRAATMNPFSQIIRSGLAIAGGSDSTVTPLDPFLGMKAAIAHNSKEFRIDVDAALRMFTSWAAYAGRQEEERGSLEPGKAADFCLVDTDPYSTDDISETKVIATWVAGSNPERLQG